MQALRFPSATTALIGGLAFGLASIATTPLSAAETYVPAPPEPGTEIPSATVNFGMRPYADNTFYVIAMKQGWFEDVGIEVGPEELGLKVTDTNVIALLLNRQLDMSSQYCPLLLPTYKTSAQLKCVGFTDNFLGTAILANPALELKSFKDYIAEGMDFDEAIKAALAPLEGKTLVGSPVLSKRPFEEAVQQFSGVSWNLETMDDAKALVLAKAAASISPIPRARRSSTRCCRLDGQIWSISATSTSMGRAASTPRSRSSWRSSASPLTPIS